MDIAERSGSVRNNTQRRSRVREGGLPSPEESGISIDREREVRGTYLGGFPEPERAIRGARPVRARLRAKIRLLYCTMVN